MPNEELCAARERVTELLETVGLELEINGKKRDRLVCLKRRANWLKARIESRSGGQIYHYDEAEMVATEWAVSHIIVLEEEVKRFRGLLQERGKTTNPKQEQKGDAA